MQDIVFPKNNEKEFLEIAEKLNKEICFVYEFRDKKSFKEKTKNSKVKVVALVKPNQIEKARNIADFIIVKASENNRPLFERKNIMICSLELSKKPDFIYNRNSGLNQVLCSLANKNNITACFSFNEILNSDKLIRARIIGRMMQNIRFCRKYKVKTIFASFATKPYEIRSHYELMSFAKVLGINYPKK